MEGPSNEIGAFEAKTRLSELLRETERGGSFVILRRGKPVARLVPLDAEPGADDLADLKQAFLAVRKGIKGRVKVKRLVEEGRRR
jgi:prevent-host-death family protein